MSYVKKVTRSGEKQHKKVVERRAKTYYNTNKWGNEKKTQGHEIVKEINICEKCAEKGEHKSGNSKSR